MQGSMLDSKDTKKKRRVSYPEGAYSPAEEWQNRELLIARQVESDCERQQKAIRGSVRQVL